MNHAVTKRVLAFAAALTAIFWTLSALAAGGGGHGDPTQPTPIPGNDIVEAIINFTLFILLLWYFGKGPVGKFFTERRAALAADIEEARRLREEAEEKLTSYSSRLDTIDSERKEILEGYRRQAEEEREAIVSAAKAVAERLKEEAKIAIEHEVKRARTELKEQVVEEAIQSARDKVREKLDAGTRARLVDDYASALGSIEGGA